jgi:hypothetical protein
VTYGFDTSDLVVWLSPFEAGEQGRPYGSGILCRRHADALVVPRGWRVDDRREAVPRLFLAPAASHDPSGETPRTRTERKKSGDKPVASELFDAVVPAVPHDATDELEETKAIPWSPRLLDADDAGDVRDESTPQKGGLLARAFGNKERRDKQ